MLNTKRRKKYFFLHNKQNNCQQTTTKQASRQARKETRRRENKKKKERKMLTSKFSLPIPKNFMFSGLLFSGSSNRNRLFAPRFPSSSASREFDHALELQRKLTKRARARIETGGSCVPSDCEISQSTQPFPIAEIAKTYVIYTINTFLYINNYLIFIREFQLNIWIFTGGIKPKFT